MGDKYTLICSKFMQIVRGAGVLIIKGGIISSEYGSHTLVTSDHPQLQDYQYGSHYC